MGTAPLNFPPESVLQIGQTQTGNALGLTADLAQTVFFTAPTQGLYLISMALQIVVTDGAGSLVATITTPTAGNLASNLTPSGPLDGFSPAIPVWMNIGDTLEVATVADGLTGTTYNVYVIATRVF